MPPAGGRLLGRGDWAPAAGVSDSVDIAGAGFGTFIDELGKFITRDHDYFFRPTAGLLYVIFVLLFLAFRALDRLTLPAPQAR